MVLATDKEQDIMNVLMAEILHRPRDLHDS